jgi:hypothetical protein
MNLLTEGPDWRRFDLVLIDHVVAERAVIVDPRELRSLDAIDLASALSLMADLKEFVAYDAGLCSSAAGAVLPVVTPT